MGANGGHQGAHGLGDGARDVQGVNGEGHKGRGGDSAVDAPHFSGGGALIVDAGDAPDHARQGHKDNDGVQAAVLGQRGAKENFAAVLADDFLCPGIEHFQGSGNKVLLIGSDSGLAHDFAGVQAPPHFGGKGVELGLGGIGVQKEL